MGEHKALPADFDTLAAQPGVNLPRHDPAGGKDYRYRPLDATHYELCADFATDSGERSARWRLPAAGQWVHPAGPHCFRRSAGDKD